MVDLAGRLCNMLNVCVYAGLVERLSERHDTLRTEGYVTGLQTILHVSCLACSFLSPPLVFSLFFFSLLEEAGGAAYCYRCRCTKVVLLSSMSTANDQYRWTGC